MSLLKANGGGLGGAGAPGGALGNFYSHLLDQSLKFDDGDGQYLTRTPASAGNRKTWTWSGWVKRGNISSFQGLFASRSALNDASYMYTAFNSSDTFQFTIYSTTLATTSQVFRDPLAWYHIVVAFDATASAAADRLKIYVNGSEADLSTDNRSSISNQDYAWNQAGLHFISGRYVNSWGSGFDGYLAEINVIDGTALTAASFGETKDGIWIPKDTSGLTFGTNGFHLTFKDDVISEGFNTVTYAGTGEAQSISGLGFEPDFVWIKERSSTSAHVLMDSVRGNSKFLVSSSTQAESTATSIHQSFDADGFTVGNSGAVSQASQTYVGWCWEAGGAPTADNSAGAGATPTAGSVKIDGSNLGSALGGSIAATRLSANTSRGFSIVKYTGTGSNATVAHGLSSAPEMIIFKKIDVVTSWMVYNKTVGNNRFVYLDLNNGQTGTDSTYFNDSDPTSSLINLGSYHRNNSSSEPYIAYAFHSVSGYSKIGSYTGNGGSNNAVTGLGFKPAWLMVKRIDTTTTYSNWWIQDGTRNPTNVGNTLNIAADTDAAETNALEIDFDSDGFTLQDGSQGSNISGGTYIYMAFADTREAAFFKDVSTNGNHFTPVNLDYRDSVPDVPTNNFATLNSLDSESGSLSEGNLKLSKAADASGRATFYFDISDTTGWYWEQRVSSLGTAFAGIANQNHVTIPTSANSLSGNIYGILTDARKVIDTSRTSYGSSLSDGDIVGVHCHSGEVDLYVNGAAYPSASNTLVSGLSGLYAPIAGCYSGTPVNIMNFGQDSSFAGNHATANSNADANGRGSFAYSPQGLALCSQNLPNVDIIDGTEYFNTVLYTGNATDATAISGVGFSPDWTWIKVRNNTNNHRLFDTVRGAGKDLISNSTGSESTTTTRLQSFDSDGFTVGTNAEVNSNGHNIAAWNWLAGTAFSNDASATGVGTIDSEGQVNATAGFSIIKYTGTGSNGTIAHGLSSAPNLVILKGRNEARQWIIGSDALTDWTKYLLFTNASEATAADLWNSTAPSSSVLSVGTNINSNKSTVNYIAYCFHSVEGYSKVGSYTGNGSADGPFIYTGFKPAWILIKKSSATGDWVLHDTVRDSFNPSEDRLYANKTDAEIDAIAWDSVSNGFKIRNTSSGINTNNATNIYLAFAESPFKFANAR